MPFLSSLDRRLLQQTLSDAFASSTSTWSTFLQRLPLNDSWEVKIVTIKGEEKNDILLDCELMQYKML